MKRSIISAFAVFFILALFTSLSQAQSTGNGTKGGNPNAPRINWVDANGDGICDNFGTAKQGLGKGYGVKDGSGKHIRPQDGTGYGKKGGNRTGTGTCDGTGPKGKNRRGGK